ncbi:MAG: DNA repair protein RecN [Clostridiales bacterium]|nr:MAG: DNA repair protein RecN [Clostridiales bacterium]
MITCLQIENIAVIEKVEINLSEGFIVLTGQTGAGKTVLINSLQMILGDRVSKDVIRSGCDNAKVSASFSLTESYESIKEFCENRGIDFDDELVIRREIHSDGRSRAFVNGNIVTLSVLKQLGCMLVNIHGQHDNHALMDSESHRDFLDKYAKNEKELLDYKSTYKKYLSIKHELNSLETDDQKKEEQVELLRFEIEEIENAELEIGEEEILEERRKTLINFEKVKLSLESAFELLSGDDGADERLRRVRTSLSGISSLGSEYEKLYDTAENVYDSFSELSRDIRDMSNSLEYDQEELDNIEERLELISKLKRKYGLDIAEILSYLEDAKLRLDRIETSDARKNELVSELYKMKEQVLKCGEALTSTRKAAASKLEKQIISQLEFLEMPKVSFSVFFDSVKPTENGCDRIEFLISTNPGQELRPLAKTASGGELSRIMLSIKNALAGCDSVETLIFDEIDTGVSGSTAEKIAKKMKQMSLSKQVLSVTHLAQIAAYADEHLLIGKTTDEFRTFTTVKPLSEKERINEVARIIGGETPSEAFIASAKELILNAKL